MNTDRSKILPYKSDEELLNSYRNTLDSKFLGLLFNKYLHFTYGVCLKYLKNREDSKDAVMQIFEQLHHDLKNKEVQNFQSWLYVVSKNHCLMQLRKSKIQVDIDSISQEASFFMESSDFLHPNSDGENEQAHKKLKDCLEQLSEQQKKCVELFYLKSFCYNEIVEKTAFDLKKVKSHIQNGKRNLKNCMEK